MSKQSKNFRKAGLAPLFTLALALCCLITACQDSVSYTRILRPERPLAARPVASVEVFAVTPPARSHKDIGIFQVGERPFSQDRTMTDLIDVARANAAAIGCDAILVISVDPLGGKGRPANIQASCIVYDDPSPTAGQPAP